IGRKAFGRIAKLTPDRALNLIDKRRSRDIGGQTEARLDPASRERGGKNTRRIRRVEMGVPRFEAGPPDAPVRRARLSPYHRFAARKIGFGGAFEAARQPAFELARAPATAETPMRETTGPRQP